MLENALLELETDLENIENVNKVFRAFHTIKGSGAYLGLKRLTELAHLAESLLSRMRDKEIKCSGGYADLALISCDMLGDMLENVNEALSGKPMVLPGNYRKLIEILSSPEEAGINENENFDGISSSEKEEDISTENAKGKKSGDKKDNSGESTVRVRTDRLDSLIDIVGELVIAQSMIFTG